MPCTTTWVTSTYATTTCNKVVSFSKHIHKQAHTHIHIQIIQRPALNKVLIFRGWCLLSQPNARIYTHKHRNTQKHTTYCLVQRTYTHRQTQKYRNTHNTLAGLQQFPMSLINAFFTLVDEISY